MKEIWVVLEPQQDSPKVLLSIFKNPIKYHKYNQGMIALTVAPKIRPHKKYIAIKYHQFHI